jgi:nicotinamidase-related amidase
MRATRDDLHGNVPDDADVALLLIDVINDLEFDGGEALRTQALPVAAHIAALKRRAKQAGIPAVYVNDNFGRWQSDFAKLLAHCLTDGVLHDHPGTPCRWDTRKGTAGGGCRLHRCYRVQIISLLTPDSG